MKIESRIQGTNAAALLRGGIIKASAPCRVDSGGTFDIRALALPLEGLSPVTLNIAVSLRTTVVLSGFQEGLIKISSGGIGHEEILPFEEAPFNSPLGTMSAAVSHFGYHGLAVRIEAEAPVQSALGGSSTALVALLKALSALREASGGRRMPPGAILHLAFQLEDSLAGGFCGAQDQAAAVYGGVNLWFWRFSEPGRLAKRIRLLDSKGENALSERLLIANSGIKHISGEINRGWARDFLSGGNRNLWLKANDAVTRLADALRAGRWKEAVNAVREEMAIRSRLTPDALVPVTTRLIQEAEANNCGARFAGAGSGGCVWAIGEKRDVSRLREAWGAILSGVDGAGILDCRVASRGAVVEAHISS
jgi:D-glycero-alpha-D-manno-heptose-7-phosphate kinase